MVQDVVVAKLVEIARACPGDDMRRDEIEYGGRQFASSSHLDDIGFTFDFDGHVFRALSAGPKLGKECGPGRCRSSG